jgi:hypothetical protein
LAYSFIWFDNLYGMLPPGNSIGWQLIGSGALEAHHTLGLLLAVGHAVGVVADMLLGGVGQALLAGGLIRHASSALNRKGGWMRPSQVCG